MSLVVSRPLTGEVSRSYTIYPPLPCCVGALVYIEILRSRLMDRGFAWVVVSSSLNNFRKTRIVGFFSAKRSEKPKWDGLKVDPKNTRLQGDQETVIPINWRLCAYSG